ncbi:dGTPase [Croceivirga radicis]|uniref:dGTPase n=1 Tax=Croceivirga radicis TaxID=1929488 RepID=A0A1V6LV67_9FLAO|nr:dNTP triphosphohydrolase [Croceivirga radicis]OQD44071.1 dGTPase [Croceivirga radicis]
MEWHKLLSLKRFGDTQERPRKAQDETRLGFEVDYDRIIFSSEFRSLQDKTQVMPLPIHIGSDRNFVHTRLTHSLEVSVVGRSLGRKVGIELLKKYPELSTDLGYRFNDFGTITAAAALAHDIGNPPFGHSGEKAIGNFFASGLGKQYKKFLTDSEYQDLVDFEGNANGLRLLTASRKGIPGGLRLSYATLGAFVKYPKASLPKKPTKHISDKKYGYFQSEKDFFDALANDLGLLKKTAGDNPSYHRHPLVYLVEAADDICYTIIDFEDGINLGLIPEDYALEYMIKLVKDSINTNKYHEMESVSDRLSYLRALAINTLINEAARVFMENETAILNGIFDCALLDKSTYKAQIEDIINLCVNKIYQSKEVVEKELAGYKIIENILEHYCEAVLNAKGNQAGSYDRLLLGTLPDHLKDVDKSVYELLLGVCSFVAGLSDSAAVKLNNTLTGKHL